MRIYDGDVKARVEVAVKELGNVEATYLPEVVAFSVTIETIDKLYKTKGWESVARVIGNVNHKCWYYFEKGEKELSKFYSDLYHAACAWYQGYPSNQYEVDNADSDGCFDHVSEDDMYRIYKYLD